VRVAEDREFAVDLGWGIGVILDDPVLLL